MKKKQKQQEQIQVVEKQIKENKVRATKRIQTEDKIDYDLFVSMLYPRSKDLNDKTLHKFYYVVVSHKMNNRLSFFKDTMNFSRIDIDINSGNILLWVLSIADNPDFIVEGGINGTTKY